MVRAPWPCPLRLRLYDRRQMVGGDLGRDFRGGAWPAPDLPIAPEGAQCLSPSAALIGLYLRLPPIEKLQQINRRMVASGPSGGDRQRRSVHARVDRARIRDTYAEPNEAIRSVWFLDTPDAFRSAGCAPARARRPGRLAGLLLKTITKMRGPEVAEAARIALDRACRRAMNPRARVIDAETDAICCRVVYGLCTPAFVGARVEPSSPWWRSAFGFRVVAGDAVDDPIAAGQIDQIAVVIGRHMLLVRGWRRPRPSPSGPPASAQKGELRAFKSHGNPVFQTRSGWPAPRIAGRRRHRR